MENYRPRSVPEQTVFRHQNFGEFPFQHHAFINKNRYTDLLRNIFTNDLQMSHILPNEVLQDIEISYL